MSYQQVDSAADAGKPADGDAVVGESGDKKDGPTLLRELNAFDLTVLGVGGIVGAGIFVVSGTWACSRAHALAMRASRTTRTHTGVRASLARTGSPASELILGPLLQARPRTSMRVRRSSCRLRLPACARSYMPYPLRSSRPW